MKKPRSPKGAERHRGQRCWPIVETQDKASEETPESAQTDTESAAVTIREYEAVRIGRNCVLYPWNEANSAAIRRRLALRRLLSFVPRHPQEQSCSQGQSLLPQKQFLAKTAAMRGCASPHALRHAGVVRVGRRAPLSDLNHAEVIRQAETLEEALRASDRRSDETQQHRPGLQKCNDTGFIAIWSQNGRYAHPVRSRMMRGYAEARCLECLANPGGFDGPTGAE